MSRGASGSISLNSYVNVFVLFIVSRASSEYISERLDGSTHHRFAMPWCPDSQPQSLLDLLIDCYLWAFHLYHQERAHIQHHWVILCSFAWAGFTVGISDHSRKGWNPDREPFRRKTKNTKPHNAYDIVKYAKDLEKGNTIMKNYGDPQSQMCRIGGFLSEVYDDA